ncbi:ribbon-helix-helix domain-containing protein [Natrinema salaciae]|uniref:Ribbon-helix-helix protein, copG family n=1 Tax=Natrinema salaciae TaxID=1186196 RepID=A0A1H9NIV2_9EURY|nr:ribbon-helix-helix domain-containing protein [Natrinema salaciae]SER35595.1 Ribbon-helix-helix protein, copG family [Natrinema salaciae]
MAQQPSASDITPEPANSRLADRQPLDRVTFRATDEQLDALESLVDAGAYPTRSAAIRAGIQQLLEQHARVDADSGSQ